MYFLTGRDSVTETIVQLGCLATKDSAAERTSPLSGYRAFLRTIMPLDLLPTEPDHQICFDETRIEALVSTYTGKCKLTDIGSAIIETPVAAMREAMTVVSTAKSTFARRDPQLAALFDLVIHTLFYARSPDSGGGSNSSAIGVIWCANRRSWSDDDLHEFFVHELTHNLVFLDELFHQHYFDLNEVAKPENYATSAILKTGRPLDKVFHSIVVAHEILQWRNRHGEPTGPMVHPPSSALIKNCLTSIASFNSVARTKPSLLTERPRQLVSLIEEVLRSKPAFI